MVLAGRLQAAAWALVAAQVVHAFVPADTESDSSVGPVVGLALLVASLTGVYGLRTGTPWAVSVVGWTGVAVAAGFVAYHAAPWHSPMTNPYVGEGVGVTAWLSVALAVAAGAWAAWEARAATARAACT